MQGRDMANHLFPNRPSKVYKVWYLEEFWIGWALAYLQWYTHLRFKTLIDIIPYSTFRVLYKEYNDKDVSVLGMFADKYIIGHEEEKLVYDENTRSCKYIPR
jgi:hypothetical protein